MNRNIDLRTDLYSLGITLYHLLAGELSFFSKDMLEVIHFHMATKPENLHQLNNDIPEIISGYSCIGKTTIVSEIHKPVVQNKGLFISGKYDQYNRNIPYYAFIRDFFQLLCYILLLFCFC